MFAVTPLSPLASPLEPGTSSHTVAPIASCGLPRWFDGTGFPEEMVFINLLSTVSPQTECQFFTFPFLISASYSDSQHTGWCSVFHIQVLHSKPSLQHHYFWATLKDAESLSSYIPLGCKRSQKMWALADQNGTHTSYWIWKCRRKNLRGKGKQEGGRD